MQKRVFASMLVLLASLIGRAEDSGQLSADIKVGDTTYRVVDRIVLANALTFHQPHDPKDGPCISRRVKSKSDKNCGIPAGRILYGILGCGGNVSPAPETVAETFARVPGRDAPNLFASITSIHAGEHDEGELEIVVLACGPRIAIPVAEKGRPDENGLPYKFNQLSLQITSTNGVADLTLTGIETRPESYRIAGVNEAVLFLVPLRAVGPLQIEREKASDQPQTRSVDLLWGDFAAGSYSARDNRYVANVHRDVVPAGHHPISVVSRTQ